MKFEYCSLRSRGYLCRQSRHAAARLAAAVLLPFLMCFALAAPAIATAAATAETAGPASADAVTPAVNANMKLQPATFTFADGGNALFYQWDKQPWQSDTAAMASPVNLLFVVAGAGCGSMGRYLPQYFTGWEGESGLTRIRVLLKRHISAQANGETCSEAFIRADHLSQWRADQLAFIQAQLRQFKQQGMQPRRVILLGISEGAELVPLLARDLPQITHLALLANAGNSAIPTYRALAAIYPHMQQGWDVLSRALASSPADPEQARIHGRGWRYWSEIAIDQTRNLLAARLPVFAGIGEADTLIPPGAANALRKAFSDAGRSDFQLRIYPAADHGLRSPDKNYLPDFMWQLDQWLLEDCVPEPSFR
ncbi:dienelactone hydrolase family protein [Undibacterium sp. FT147W]|uniref:Dienelactone hydrolase family protein n=1 Tax=Undibacterium rivi TaxID=2828729 RepID=A0ABS5H6U1_9BURK|nr:dienelactone hydrolase family protein [Undibacterium rivi]MBR7794360.1 dienelactone hydrolase family protein [Undibacterium rivi]